MDPLQVAPENCQFCGSPRGGGAHCFVTIDVPLMSLPFGQTQHRIAFPCEVCASCASRISFGDRAILWVGAMAVVIALGVFIVVALASDLATAVDRVGWVGIGSTLFSGLAVRLILGSWKILLPKSVQDHALAMSRKYLKNVTPTIVVTAGPAGAQLVEPMDLAGGSP